MTRLRYLLGIILIVLSLLFLYTQQALWSSLQKISGFELAALGLLTALSLFFLGLQFKYMLGLFKLNLTIFEWFGLTAVNSMINHYLPMQGGTMIRAVYLKYQHNFLISHYVSMLWVSQLFMLGVAALLGWGSVMLYQSPIQINWLALVFILIFCACILAYYLAPYMIDRMQSIPMLKYAKFDLKSVLSGFQHWQTSQKSILYFCGLILALNLTWAVRLYLSFAILDDQFNWQDDFMAILLIQSIISTTLFFSFTPANLGIKEGVIVMGAQLIDVPLETALLASLVDRASSAVVIFALGLIYSPLLIKKYKN